MSNAIVVGLGGIGKNVYVPQLEKLGFEVESVDIDSDSGATYENIKDIPKETEYEIAVICTPNIYHLPNVLDLSHHCKKILVEKPGFANPYAWENVQNRLLPDHDITLVKNNLYRPEYKMLRAKCNDSNITKIEITWFNKDRIPNPGSWFTDRMMAFGGVTHDLFPHLYTFMLLLFPVEQVIGASFISARSEQRWNLTNIGTSTDYGTINPNGIYNVCDYAESHYMINNIKVSLRSSWKEGHDDQSIRIHYNNGSEFKWMFGLCPDEMYGKMLNASLKTDIGTDTFNNLMDPWIHQQLEYFK